MRKCKTVLDSGFHAVDFGFHALDSSRCQWNFDSSIQIVRGIPDSLSRIPAFQSPGFQIPQANISRIAESEFPYMA